MAARIFTVADTFDAVTTDRPYHDRPIVGGGGLDDRGGRGSQFDPDAADAFLRIPFEAWARVAAATGGKLRRAGHPETRGREGS